MAFEDEYGRGRGSRNNSDRRALKFIAHCLLVTQDTEDADSSDGEQSSVLRDGSMMSYLEWRSKLADWVDRRMAKNFFFATFDHMDIDDDGFVRMTFMAADARSAALCAPVSQRQQEIEKAYWNQSLRDDADRERVRNTVDISLNRRYQGADAYYQTYWERRHDIDRLATSPEHEIQSTAFDGLDVYTITIAPDSPRSVPVWAQLEDVSGRWFMICTGVLLDDPSLRRTPKEHAPEQDSESDDPISHYFRNDVFGLVDSSAMEKLGYLNDAVPEGNGVHRCFARVEPYYIGTDPNPSYDENELVDSPACVYQLPEALSNRLACLADPAPYLTYLECNEDHSREELRANRQNEAIARDDGRDDSGQVQPMLMNRDKVLRMAVHGGAAGNGANGTGSGTGQAGQSQPVVYSPITPGAVASQIPQLAQLPAFSQVVAFDVGQGQCLGFLDDTGKVRAYFDVGLGLHETSTPQYCTCADPIVILSSWDKDHWLGVSLEHELLKRPWIVPSAGRPVGVSTGKHKGRWNIAKLVSCIGANNNANVYCLASHLPSCLDISLSNAVGGASPDAQRLVVCETSDMRPDGKTSVSDHNDIGIVIAVINETKQATWLFVEDAGYDTIGCSKQPEQSWPGDILKEDEKIAVMTASHHGARLTRSDNIPPKRTDAQDYARLMFSFGTSDSGNQYGHPSPAAIAKYIEAGWKLPGNGWPISNRGEGDFLSTSTAVRPTGKAVVDRSPIAAGWDKPPQYTNASHLIAVHHISSIKV